MSYEAQLHQAQTVILRELLFIDRAGFAALQKPTGLSSDHFKFHIRRLLELGYIEKARDGKYRLSSAGKEYANKLDTDNNTIERQPKSAVILVAEKMVGGTSYVLAQERRKHPYFGFWGFPSGKIRWGETILQTAARELDEETGLRAHYKHRAVYHEHAIDLDTGEILEDKIFHIIYCYRIEGDLKVDFDGGHNEWMMAADARAKVKKFNSFDIETDIGLGLKRTKFIEAAQYYSKEQF